MLHISSALGWRGGEQQLAYLLEELKKLEQEQIVLCARGSAMAGFCREKRFQCITYRKRFSFNPLVGVLIKRVCRQRGIDLVHAHDSHAHTFAYLAALMGNKTPIVVSRRVDFPIGKSRFSLNKYHHPAVRRILCVSEEIRKVLLRDYRFPERTAVVYSGIDAEKFQGGATGILHREYGIPGDTAIIANVAAIAPHKDYFTFVNCVELLVRRGIGAVFFIIGGDGGEREAVERYIRAKKLEGRIFLTGHREDIPLILPEITVMLFTSRTEGLGTSVLDAMACGVPVVATAAGGIPELIEDGQTGLLAPVGDAEKLAAQVERVLVDPILRSHLVRNAKTRAANFSTEAMAKDTLAQYNLL